MRFTRSASPSAILALAPFYPLSGAEIVRRLKTSVERAEGGKGTLKRFGALMGVPRSTIHDWMHGADQTEPIKRFITGIERLPDAQKLEFLRRVCRFLPRLDDTRIANSPGADVIAAMLQQPTGIIFVSGATDWAGTFLFTAMGHRLVASNDVTGIDQHTPAHFVPVPRLFYPREKISAAAFRSSVQDLWAKMVHGSDGPLLLNGVWKHLPEKRTEITKLGSRRLVIVGNGLPADVRKAVCSVAAIRVKPVSHERWTLDISQSVAIA